MASATRVPPRGAEAPLGREGTKARGVGPTLTAPPPRLRGWRRPQCAQCAVRGGRRHARAQAPAAGAENPTAPTPTPQQSFTGGEHLLDRLVAACSSDTLAGSAPRGPGYGRDLVPFAFDGDDAPPAPVAAAGELGFAPTPGKRNGGGGTPAGKGRDAKDKKGAKSAKGKKGGDAVAATPPPPTTTGKKKKAPSVAPSTAPPAPASYAGPGFYVSPTPDALPPPPASLLAPRSTVQASPSPVPAGAAAVLAPSPTPSAGEALLASLRIW